MLNEAKVKYSPLRRQVFPRRPKAAVSVKGILIIIFGIYTRCQQMKVRVLWRKFECRKDIHYKTQTRTSCEKCNSKAFRLGIEPASSGLLFFATGPGLGLIMYIFTTLEFPSQNSDFHLVSVKAVQTWCICKVNNIPLFIKTGIDREPPMQVGIFLIQLVVQ